MEVIMETTSLDYLLFPFFTNGPVSNMTINFLFLTPGINFL